MTLASHATAALGARGALLSGHGAEYARLVWLAILGHTKWPGRRPGPTWASNQTLANETGLELNDVETAVSVLRNAGMLETPTGHRPGAARRIGRLLVPRIGAACKVLVPTGFDIRNLWALARTVRKRAASLVTAMVGAYALACDHASARIDEWSMLGCTRAAWRRFVGAKKNASWVERVRELEGLGLIRREGRAVFVSPPRAWFTLAVDAAECSRTRDKILEVDHEYIDGGLDRLRQILESVEVCEVVSISGLSRDLPGLEDEVRCVGEQKRSAGSGARIVRAGRREYLAAANLGLGPGVLDHADTNSPWAEVFQFPGMHEADVLSMLPTPRLARCRGRRAGMRRTGTNTS